MAAARWHWRGTLGNSAPGQPHIDERVINQHQFVEVELVGEPFPLGLVQNALVIVIAQGPAQLVVVHLGFALADPPESGHLIRVLDDKFPVVSLPGDDALVLLFPKQLQDKVPQLDLPRARG